MECIKYHTLSYMKTLKTIIWMGTSRKDIARFPDSAKKVVGTELMRLQSGLQPKNSRPMKSIGSGVFEIKIRVSASAYRVMYVTRTRDSIVVLHCFEKKSRKTSKADIDIATRRLMT